MSGPTLDAVEIERLVREVLQRLNGNEQTNGAAKDPLARSPGGAGELVLDGRVITLGEIEGKLASVTRLVVPVRAVVTPAVQDLLRKNNVALQRADQPAPGSPRREIAIGQAGSTVPIERLVERLTTAGYGVDRMAASGIGGVVKELCEQVTRSGKLALLASEATDLALCLANRRRGVRAALGQDLAGVRRAVAAIGANLLVVDPRGKSEAMLERLAREFIEAKRMSHEQITQLLDGESEPGACPCASQK